MKELKQHDFTGKELEGVKLKGKLPKEGANPQIIKDYVLAIRRNMRQWSANTKGRSEIEATTKKPHPQKGTGRARQGTLVATQFRGGATVFGPKPKFDQHVRINQKERRLAIATLLGEKIQAGDVSVLKLDAIKKPQTKNAAAYLEAIGIRGSRILVVGKSGDKTCEVLVKSMRNIPKVSFLPAQSISGYDLLKHQKLVVVDSAIDELSTLLGSAK